MDILNDVREYIRETMTQRYLYLVATKGVNSYDARHDAKDTTLYRTLGYCNEDGQHYNVNFADVMNEIESVYHTLETVYKTL